MPNGRSKGYKQTFDHSEREIVIMNDKARIEKAKQNLIDIARTSFERFQKKAIVNVIYHNEEDVKRLYENKCSKYKAEQLTDSLKAILYEESVKEVIVMDSINNGLFC